MHNKLVRIGQVVATVATPYLTRYDLMKNDYRIPAGSILKIDTSVFDDVFLNTPIS